MSNAAHTKMTAEKPTPLRFHAAFDATAAARAALGKDDLRPINIDVRIALTTVLGALARLTAMRSAIVKSLPAFDLAQFDALGTYAEALAYAQSAFLAFSRDARELPELVAKASRIRAQLSSDANALARRGLLDEKPLAALKGTTGFLNIASDVGVLVRMLRLRWSEIQAKSAIQPAELDEAEQLFEQITAAYAGRKHRSAKAAAAIEDRKRAFALLIRAYDQARRAAIFLRWSEDDADAIAPSLWAGRGGRRQRAKTKKQTEAPNDPVMPAAITMEGAAAAAAIPEAPEPEPGLRGSHPFTQH